MWRVWRLVAPVGSLLIRTRLPPLPGAAARCCLPTVATGVRPQRPGPGPPAVRVQLAVASSEAGVTAHRRDGLTGRPQRPTVHPPGRTRLATALCQWQARPVSGQCPWVPPTDRATRGAASAPAGVPTAPQVNPPQGRTSTSIGDVADHVTRGGMWRRGGARGVDGGGGGGGVWGAEVGCVSVRCPVGLAEQGPQAGEQADRRAHERATAESPPPGRAAHTALMQGHAGDATSPRPGSLFANFPRAPIRKTRAFVGVWRPLATRRRARRLLSTPPQAAGCPVAPPVGGQAWGGGRGGAQSGGGTV